MSDCPRNPQSECRPRLGRMPGMLLALLAGLTMVAPSLAGGGDPFGTDQLVSLYSSRSLAGEGVADCDPVRESNDILSLAKVIELALCHNPQTRMAWANAKMQSAQVGIAKAAYFPTINASAGYLQQKEQTRVADYPQYDSDINARAKTEAVDLSMVLFDFGARAANLDNARQLLNAANASHDASLQQAFISAAEAYYEVLTSKANLQAVGTARNLAEETAKAADARFHIGLGTLVDKLQAETVSAQGTLKFVKAKGDYQNALGNLATMIGLPAETQLVLEAADDKVLPDTGFVKSVDTLIEDAKRTHPSLIAARAKVKAAQANERSARAAALPLLTLTANGQRANQPTSQLGLPPLTTSTRGSQIGVQLSIPLFDGFGHSYQIRQAAAQTEERRAEVTELESEVTLEVWKNYQALQSATEELKVSEQYKDSAAQTAAAAQGRYTAGATEILELLNAQTMLIAAQQQSIQSLADWRAARLRLAYSLGILGNWAIK